MAAAAKELNPHAEMMRVLYERTGPIPDGKAQGAAAQWLAKHYTTAEVEAELDRQLREVKAGRRRGRVSLLTVKGEIGTQRAVTGPPRPVEPSRPEEPLTKGEAVELMGALMEADAEGYSRQIGILRSLYHL